MISVTTEAFALRRIAEAGPIGKRHASFELYDLLGGCAQLAARCAGSPSDKNELRQLIAQRAPDGTRRYVELQSDVYTLVCRFVFHQLRSRAAERSNASRYAHCLRQASALGIAPGALAKHLKEKGGINALFLARPLVATTVWTKSLRLDRSIEVPKGGTLQITLRHRPDNSFEVVQLDTPSTSS